MSDDITDTLAPNSTQLDAVDLLGGSRVFIVERVVVNSNAEQPVTIHLAEFPRPWKPGKNMRRVLGYCWGTKSSAWVGHRAELFCDTSVSYGGKAVGGVRISRLSHIDGQKKVPQIETRGKGGTYTVDPLPDAPAAPTPEPLTAAMIACCDDRGQLGQWWREHKDQRAAIEARVAKLDTAATQDGV